jgi:hypothetical protein
MRRFVRGNGKAEGSLVDVGSKVLYACTKYQLPICGGLRALDANPARSHATSGAIVRDLAWAALKMVGLSKEGGGSSCILWTQRPAIQASIKARISLVWLVYCH